jgi:hypothetical protein
VSIVDIAHLGEAWRERRIQRAMDMLFAAQAKLTERGVTGYRTMPSRLAHEMLEAGSLEDDADLRKYWIHLLANFADASSGVELNRSFPRVLSELSPLEGLIVEKVYTASSTAPDASVLTQYLPHEIRYVSALSLQGTPAGPPDSATRLAVANLVRLGLLAHGRALETAFEMNGLVDWTVFGEEFHKACSAQTPRSSRA